MLNPFYQSFAAFIWFRNNKALKAFNNRMDIQKEYFKNYKNITKNINIP